MQVFEAIHSAFDWLPIGALVGDKALVIHGGLGRGRSAGQEGRGDGSWGLHDLEHIKRPMQAAAAVRTPTTAWLAVSMRMRQGFKVMHGGHLITLFSARRLDVSEAEEQSEDVGTVLRLGVVTKATVQLVIRKVTSAQDAAMLLLATDLNGHLRVHPKRIAFMPNPGPPKPSWWEKTMQLV
ncbi:hypothetical protein AK812_SmicGene9814 [Symbiodinium microadriaticum]|uniref:Uncharacterized protein n=1 Tax=Symbiodinium microadriaticum TaxID=2951 RepID=A0A1Q9EHB8_SYMMI|nr:hypothetical protein AK812_SmicGene9814 [Symbiodinium microadriaticum]